MQLGDLMLPVIPCKKLSQSAKLPYRARLEDAGFDIYSDEDILLYPNQPTKIKTNIALQIPDGYVGILMDKSGVGAKGVKVFGGVIDSSYRGEIIVVLSFLSSPTYNESGFPNLYRIEKGQKICQIVFLETPLFSVEEAKELNSTERGEKGFGSTGMV